MISRSLLWQNFLDLITELEKLDRVSSEKVDFVEECLRNVGRVDLAKKVNVYKMSGERVLSFCLLSLKCWNLANLKNVKWNWCSSVVSCFSHTWREYEIWHFYSKKKRIRNHITVSIRQETQSKSCTLTSNWNPKASIFQKLWVSLLKWDELIQIEQCTKYL